ncbi:hypothetical protein ACFL43_02535 [Thermodesulfobacteriota bacterium]
MAGVIENQIGSLIEINQVIESDFTFLKQSLASAMKHFVTLGAVKGALAVINHSEPFGIAIGKIISPVAESVDFLWRMISWSMISITAQMALLKFFQSVGIKVCFAGGAAAYVLSLDIIDCLKKTGVALMAVGLTLYVLMPYSIYISRVMFEKNSVTANRQLAQSIEGFRARVNQVELFSLKNLRPKYARKTAEQIRVSLSKGLDVLITAVVKYLVNLATMFVITPVFFYGLVYLVIRKSLDCIGVPQVIVKLDEQIIKTASKM